MSDLEGKAFGNEERWDVGNIERRERDNLRGGEAL